MLLLFSDKQVFLFIEFFVKLQIEEDGFSLKKVDFVEFLTCACFHNFLF